MWPTFTISVCVCEKRCFIQHVWTSVTLFYVNQFLNTLWTGDADLHLYITTVQDDANLHFLTCAWFPRTVHLITQYMEPVSEWFCWRMFIETWPHSELMICDKYWEQLFIFHCSSALHLVSVQTSTMTERGSSYEEK